MVRYTYASCIAVIAALTCFALVKLLSTARPQINLIDCLIERISSYKVIVTRLACLVPHSSGLLFPSDTNSRLLSPTVIECCRSQAKAACQRHPSQCSSQRDPRTRIRQGHLRYSQRRWSAYRPGTTVRRLTPKMLMHTADLLSLNGRTCLIRSSGTQPHELDHVQYMPKPRSVSEFLQVTAFCQRSVNRPPGLAHAMPLADTRPGPSLGTISILLTCC
jgi:hypothetical protein